MTSLTKTHSKQTPFTIKGTVTLNGSAYMGARIWVRDTTEGTEYTPVDDKNLIYTNATGKYNINLANCTNAYAINDNINIYCQIGEIISTSSITVTARGSATVNFTIVRRSGLADDLRGSPLQTEFGQAGKGALQRQLTKGCTDGLQ